MRDAEDVTTIELKVAEATVGQLRMRSRDPEPDAALLRLVTTLIASEVERVRAPERASEEAATSFQRAVLARRIARPRRPGRPRQGARDRPRRRRHASSWSAPIRATRPRTTGAGGCSRSPPAGRGRSRPGRSPRRPRTTPARSSCSCPIPTARPAAGSPPPRSRELESGLAGLRVRDRPQPPRRRSRRPAPRRQRGAARRQRRRGRPRALDARRSRRPAPTSCCCRT